MKKIPCDRNKYLKIQEMIYSEFALNLKPQSPKRKSSVMWLFFEMDEFIDAMLTDTFLATLEKKADATEDQARWVITDMRDKFLNALDLLGSIECAIQLHQ